MTQRHGYDMDERVTTPGYIVAPLLAAWESIDALAAQMAGSPEAAAWAAAWRAARCWHSPSVRLNDDEQALLRSKLDADLPALEQEEERCRLALLTAFGQPVDALMMRTPERRWGGRPWERTEEGQREGSIRRRRRSEELAYRVGDIYVVAFDGRYHAGVENDYGYMRTLVAVDMLGARAHAHVGDAGAILLQQEAIIAMGESIR